MTAYQPALPTLCPAAAAAEHLAQGGEAARGAVFTRPEVAAFILDLVGWMADRPLHTMRLLEPAFGRGDFLLPALDRLLAACARDGVAVGPDTLGAVLRGVELHRTSHAQTSARVADRLVQAGATEADADALTRLWLVQGDFLLSEPPHRYTHVVGNPP